MSFAIVHKKTDGGVWDNQDTDFDIQLKNTVGGISGFIISIGDSEYLMNLKTLVDFKKLINEKIGELTDAIITEQDYSYSTKYEEEQEEVEEAKDTDDVKVTTENTDCKNPGEEIQIAQPEEQQANIIEKPIFVDREYTSHSSDEGVVYTYKNSIDEIPPWVAFEDIIDAYKNPEIVEAYKPKQIIPEVQEETPIETPKEITEETTSDIPKEEPKIEKINIIDNIIKHRTKKIDPVIPPGFTSKLPSKPGVVKYRAKSDTMRRPQVVSEFDKPMIYEPTKPDGTLRALFML